MFFSKKLFTLMMFCAYALLSIIEYIPYHASVLYSSLTANVIFMAAEAVLDFLLPAILATVMLTEWCEKKTGKVFLSALLVSLGRIFFYAPYFYLDLFARGAEVGEGILISLLFASLSVVGFVAVSALLFLLARYVHIRGLSGKRRSLDPRLSLKESIAEGGSFDTSRRGVRVVFSISLTAFLVNLIKGPVADTVTFLVNHFDSFRMNEIFTIILDVLFLLLLMLLSQLVCTRFARALIREEK